MSCSLSHFQSLQQVLSTLLLDAKKRARPSCNCNVDWELSFQFTSASIRQAQKAFRRTIFVKHTRKKLFYIVHFFFTKFRRNALFQKIMAKRKENYRENLQRGWYQRLYQLTSLPNPNIFKFWQPSQAATAGLAGKAERHLKNGPTKELNNKFETFYCTADCVVSNKQTSAECRRYFLWSPCEQSE